MVSQQDQTPYSEPRTYTGVRVVHKMASSIVSPLRNTYRYLVRSSLTFYVCSLNCSDELFVPNWLCIRPTCYCAYTQQRQAHESPVLFYSVVLGLAGPVLAFGVPPIRERMGYRPPEPIPTTYPSTFCLHTVLTLSFFYSRLLGACSPEPSETTCAGLRGRGVKGMGRCVQACLFAPT